MENIQLGGGSCSVTHKLAACLGLLWLFAATATMLAQASETVLHSFASPPRGAYSTASLLRDAAGNLYGTSSGGGSANAGVVFRVSASGQQTVLHTFTGGADGGNPDAGVVLDSAGNLYGTTYKGGTANAGVVFKLDSSGQLTVLHSFTGKPDGSNPTASVILDAAGNLYGTTTYGGVSDAGTVYTLDPAGNETVLYSFTGGEDGGDPSAGVIRDAAGNLYGTTSNGGRWTEGVVYELSPAGQRRVLYSFTGLGDGGYPYAGVVGDSAGNLYGTTNSGGAFGQGVVYEVSPAGQETVLYSFTGGADGGGPSAGVIRDSAGDLYGTTYSGGAANMGVLYELTAGGQETVLHSFTGKPDGSYPYAGVIRDPAGNLYGTAYWGGTANLGAVFELDAAGHETLLYSFPGAGGGSYTEAGVILDSAGNLYGTAIAGGIAGVGVVFKLDTMRRETELYSFTGGADGGYPYAGVIRDSAGNLYGTASEGGVGYGVVYKVDPSGQETTLYAFAGAPDGSGPYAGVVRDPAGNLYGTTDQGGKANMGAVYKLDTSGGETVLYSFTGGADGGSPYAGVILDSAGNLYGTTYYGGTSNAGVVYKLDTTGELTVLYSFTGGADGANPAAGLVRDSAGNLYGTTSGGGSGNAGAVYELDTTGQETVLYSFTGGTDGGLPEAGLIRDAAGNLYGTNVYGGTSGAGTVYELDTTGKLTVLHSFTGGDDGGYPYASLTPGPSGSFYGTTWGDGKALSGVVFKLTPQ